MKSCGLKNERDRKQRDAPPAGCGPFAAVSGGASRWAAPMKYSGGRRGRAAAPPSAGAGGGGGPVPAESGGAERSGAERNSAERPQPQRAAGPGRAAEFRNLPGRGGQAGTWQQGGEEGLGGQGRGGHGALDSLMGLLAVGIPSGERDGGFDALQVFERLETKVFKAGVVYTFDGL